MTDQEGAPLSFFLPGEGRGAGRFQSGTLLEPQVGGGEKGRQAEQAGLVNRPGPACGQVLFNAWLTQCVFACLLKLSQHLKVRFHIKDKRNAWLSGFS